MHRFQIQNQNASRFYACGDSIRIDDAEVRKHIKVTRIRTGEEVELVDFAQSMLYIAKLREMDKKCTEFEVIHCETLKADLPIIHLYQGTPKLAKLDYIVQKSVEVGVHAIHFVDTQRSEPIKKLDRLERIALEAALQSKSPVLPSIQVSGALTGIDFSAYDAVFFCYEAQDTKSKEIDVSGVSLSEVGMKFAVIIGPEGGFTDEEVRWAEEHFGALYTLGTRIQRTETAPISAIAIIANGFRKSKSGGTLGGIHD